MKRTESSQSSQTNTKKLRKGSVAHGDEYVPSEVETISKAIILFQKLIDERKPYRRKAIYEHVKELMHYNNELFTDGIKLKWAHYHLQPRNGITPLNFTESKETLDLLREKNLPEVVLLHGIIYLNEKKNRSIQPLRDLSKAEKIFLSLQKNGHPDALKYLESLYNILGDNEKLEKAKRLHGEQNLLPKATNMISIATEKIPVKNEKELEQRLEEQLKTIYDCSKSNYTPLITAINNALEDVRSLSKYRRVNFFGSRGVGKSSLINALLGCTILQSSDTEAATAAVVELAYGNRYTIRMNWLSWLQFETIVTESESLEVIELLLDRSCEDLKCGLTEVKKIYLMWQHKFPEEMVFDDYQSLVKLLRTLTFRKEKLWPFISEVFVSGPFGCLKSGMKLVDVPGSDDGDVFLQKKTNLSSLRKNSVRIYLPCYTTCNQSTLLRTKILEEEAEGVVLTKRLSIRLEYERKKNHEMNDEDLIAEIRTAMPRGHVARDLVHFVDSFATDDLDKELIDDMWGDIQSKLSRNRLNKFKDIISKFSLITTPEMALNANIQSKMTEPLKVENLQQLKPRTSTLIHVNYENFSVTKLKAFMRNPLSADNLRNVKLCDLLESEERIQSYEDALLDAVQSRYALLIEKNIKEAENNIFNNQMIELWLTRCTAIVHSGIWPDIGKLFEPQLRQLSDWYSMTIGSQNEGIKLKIIRRLALWRSDHEKYLKNVHRLRFELENVPERFWNMHGKTSGHIQKEDYPLFRQYFYQE